MWRNHCAMDLQNFITEHILPFIAGGGIATIGTLGLTRKEKQSDIHGKDLDSASKIINEYQDYIEVLKQEREVLKTERAEALRERDEYKQQVQDLWVEVNDLKRKLANLESSMIRKFQEG